MRATPPLPPCDVCGSALEPEYIDVDIGVGVQRHCTGWTCPNGCPSGFAACNGCGVAIGAPGREHHSWCREIREVGLP